LLSAPAAAGEALGLRNRDTERWIQDRTYHFVEAGRDVPYSLYTPTSYDGSKAYPLIVALHGLGSSAAQMIRYRGLTDLAEEYRYIVVAPEGYNSHGWYGSLGPGKNRTTARFERPGDPDPENLGELSEKDVFNVIKMVENEFKIDTARVYLMGHSMGGGGTLYLGIKHADTFAGLAPIAPAIYASPTQLEKIPEMPIIVVQGDADQIVHVEVTRQWVDEMKKLAMPFKYIEVPGGDHMRVAAQNLPAIFAFFNTHSPVGGALAPDSLASRGRKGG
jgi:poly(3-hydroxybutyrate) depolymerase